MENSEAGLRNVNKIFGFKSFKLLSLSCRKVRNYNSEIRRSEPARGDQSKILNSSGSDFMKIEWILKMNSHILIIQINPADTICTS